MDPLSTGQHFSSRRSAGGHTAEHLPKEMNEMRIKEDRGITAGETGSEDKVSFFIPLRLLSLALALLNCLWHALVSVTFNIFLFVSLSL